MDNVTLAGYMNQAIEVAKRTKAAGGVAIGAVMVSPDGRVLAAGGSMVGPTHDPTAHAEINCIRRASEIAKSDDLYGSTLFSTLEPCHMCLSAAAWARIGIVYFGAYRRDVDESLFDIKGDFSDEQEAGRMNLRENETMEVRGGICEDECAELLTGYHERFKHTS